MSVTAAMIVVTGIPASGQRALEAQLTVLGTDMLTAQPVPDQDAPVLLPERAAAMVARVGPVTVATAVANTHQSVRRTDRSDPSTSVGISVLAARPDLLDAVNGHVRTGRSLSASTQAFPTVVLGYQAATWLGIGLLDPAHPAPEVDVGGHWCTVIGILDPMPLTPEPEQSVLVGWDAARTVLRFSPHSCPA